MSNSLFFCLPLAGGMILKVSLLNLISGKKSLDNQDKEKHTKVTYYYQTISVRGECLCWILKNALVQEVTLIS